MGSIAPTPFIYTEVLKLSVLQDIIVFEGKVLIKAILAKMQSLVLVRPEYNITGIFLRKINLTQGKAALTTCRLRRSSG